MFCKAMMPGTIAIVAHYGQGKTRKICLAIPKTEFAINQYKSTLQQSRIGFIFILSFRLLISVDAEAERRQAILRYIHIKRAVI